MSSRKYLLAFAAIVCLFAAFTQAAPSTTPEYETVAVDSRGDRSIIQLLLSYLDPGFFMGLAGNTARMSFNAMKLTILNYVASKPDVLNEPAFYENGKEYACVVFEYFEQLSSKLGVKGAEKDDLRNAITDRDAYKNNCLQNGQRKAMTNNEINKSINKAMEWVASQDLATGSTAGRLLSYVQYITFAFSMMGLISAVVSFIIISLIFFGVFIP
eukprot:Nk52_evm15s305 gene=Nk52_evmTU15s305